MKKNTTLSAKDMAYIGLSVALLAVCSQLCIPFAVPFTLQTFAVSAIAIILGPGKGTMTVIIYLLLGAVGLPVFSQFKGGLSALIGPTGGFLFGFIPMTLIIGLLLKNRKYPFPVQLIFGMLGNAALYFTGTLWYAYVSTGFENSIGINKILCSCIFPFILPDLLKLALAISLSKKIKASIP